MREQLRRPPGLITTSDSLLDGHDPPANIDFCKAVNEYNTTLSTINVYNELNWTPSYRRPSRYCTQDDHGRHPTRTTHWSDAIAASRRAVAAVVVGRRLS